ncbi:MAG: 30S ribosomal protein S6 [Deltaproteobacteria bacterium]|nr:30S ribosomal protein S6 [Deltaproteobacteria bacterium]
MPITKSYRDEIGKEREYEFIMILKPDCTPADIKIIVQRMHDLIERKNGQIIKFEKWGKRKLAYEIKKNNEGIYLYLRILGLFDLIPEVEKLMRMIEKVIRYMTIKIDDTVDPEARSSEFDIETLDGNIEEADVDELEVSEKDGEVVIKKVTEEDSKETEEKEAEEVTEEKADSEPETDSTETEDKPEDTKE